MAKKGASTSEKKAVLFRPTDEERALFERIAKLETGSDSVPAWAYQLCLRRAEVVDAAVKAGRIKLHQGRVVLLDELEDPKK